MVAAIEKTVITNKTERLYSLREYLAREEKSVYKHEFHNGKIVRMAGGKFKHNAIASNVVATLKYLVKPLPKKFWVINSDQKIYIESVDKAIYPDALVICEIPEYFEGREDTITNPLIIVEVLSDSTKNYDKTLKFDMYRSIPSFKEYVLIHQDRQKMTVYTKQIDATWVLKDYEGEDAVAILYALHDCPLSLKRLYRGLKLKK